MQIPLIDSISGILASNPPLRAFALPLSHWGGALTVPLCWTLCPCIGSVRTHDPHNYSTDRVSCQTSAVRRCRAVHPRLLCSGLVMPGRAALAPYRPKTILNRYNRSEPWLYGHSTVGCCVPGHLLIRLAAGASCGIIVPFQFRRACHGSGQGSA